jgi:hypothetical protein
MLLYGSVCFFLVKSTALPTALRLHVKQAQQISKIRDAKKINSTIQPDIKISRSNCLQVKVPVFYKKVFTGGLS